MKTIGKISLVVAAIVVCLGTSKSYAMQEVWESGSCPGGWLNGCGTYSIGANGGGGGAGPHYFTVWSDDGSTVCAFENYYYPSGLLVETEFKGCSNGNANPFDIQ